MKIKAVLMGADRTNEVVKIKPKHLKSKTFRHAESTYLVDPDRMMLTWERRFFVGPKKYFATYYYVRDIPRPLPVPFFNQRKSATNGEIEFPRIINNGIPADELAAIFNPWFYRTIGPIDTQWYKNIVFWVTLGIGIGTMYLIYMIVTMQGELEALRLMVEATRETVRSGSLASQ